MSVCRDHRYVQNPTCPHIRFFEGHGPTSKECGLREGKYFSAVRHMGCIDDLFCPTAMRSAASIMKGIREKAHRTLSNRAPVFQNRLSQTLIDSSHAVIRLANSGTSRILSSSSVRVHVSAAMRPPALVPVMTRGSRPASKNALTTPQWSRKNYTSTLICHSEPYSSQRMLRQIDIAPRCLVKELT